ncbi:coiled-coil domain-containing protein 169 isoform X2 [Aplysia californica]|uniref:Coiled-coil domain-containing protein 169 isoform X2 n=1 Tax=Aplysia californica TaxID=6500 RepID=A0ABM1A5V7_APLCA|nr:coiled-coil domain-containing protein 169 isoform X2 [Aplysia californica]
MADFTEFDLEKLRAELQQERQMKEMLDQSSAELKATIDELEKRYDTIENEANELIQKLRDDPEGNEWKTRFETQTEMNQQLEKQIVMLQDKVEEARKNLREAGKTPRDNRSFDDLSDANPQMVKSLEREKNSLHSQLRDLEWRLDQESKAYHKANDERKQYVLEINATKGNIGELKSKQRQMMHASQESPHRMNTHRESPTRHHPQQDTPQSNRDYNTESPRSNRDMGGNIPEDQRILDPRYGPIRKTAGVKALPSLDMV